MIDMSTIRPKNKTRKLMSFSSSRRFVNFSFSLWSLFPAPWYIMTFLSGTFRERWRRRWWADELGHSDRTTGQMKGRFVGVETLPYWRNKRRATSRPNPRRRNFANENDRYTPFYTRGSGKRKRMSAKVRLIMKSIDMKEISLFKVLVLL